MSRYVCRNLQETEISKLQLIMALYVIYIWLIVFILTSHTLSSLRLGHFMTKQDNVHTSMESVQCISIVYSICPYKYNQ